MPVQFASHGGEVSQIGPERRLAAILAADVVGFSRQMGADEAATLARIASLRADVLDPLLAEHRGRLFKTMGDGFLVEFASAVQAVACAMAIQARLIKQDATREKLQLRIGIHQGDVVIQGDDLMGDGVNIAARLEPLAEPGGICISARVREDLSGKLEVTAEDMGEQLLKNIAAPLRVFRVHTTGPAPGHAAERPALPLPDKPSLVVLPFANMSGDAEQEYFADGMVEEITTALSRSRSLFVIARNSAFTYKGRSVDIKQVGRELGVRYVLEGSVRKSGNRVRITGQLIEAETGTHIWADRFDGTLDDVFDLQDKVTTSVAAAIAPSVRQAEVQRARRVAPGALQAHDLLLRALPRLYRFTAPDLDEAIRLLRQAIQVDPDYALAHALLAQAYWQPVAQGRMARDEPPANEMVDLAQTARRLAPDDPEVLCHAAYIMSLPGGDMAGGIALVDRAIALNPNSAQGYRMSGALRAYAGQTTRALADLAIAERLNPMDRLPGLYAGYIVAHFVDGNHEAVLEWAAKTLSETPNMTGALRYRVASLALLGRTAEAQEAARRLLAVNPGYTIAYARHHVEFDMNNPYGKPGVAASLYEGLRRAGVPEG